MFAYGVRVMLTYEYSTIWVNPNLMYLLNKSKFINPNTTHLLNGSVMSIGLSNFIKQKKKISINQIYMNYEKPNK